MTLDDYIESAWKWGVLAIKRSWLFWVMHQRYVVAKEIEKCLKKYRAE
jgi:hypothetical protein